MTNLVSDNKDKNISPVSPSVLKELENAVPNKREREKVLSILRASCFSGPLPSPDFLK